MNRDLLKEYPQLIDKCREWDCGYSEAIQRIEEEEKEKNLKKWL